MISLIKFTFHIVSIILLFAGTVFLAYTVRVRRQYEDEKMLDRIKQERPEIIELTETNIIRQRFRMGLLLVILGTLLQVGIFIGDTNIFNRKYWKAEIRRLEKEIRIEDGRRSILEKKYEGCIAEKCKEAKWLKDSLTYNYRNLIGLHTKLQEAYMAYYPYATNEERFERFDVGDK